MTASQPDNPVFDLYSRYYDLLYADKDYQSEADYVCDALARLGVDGGRLIEFGSGTGKHAAILCQRGFQVVGVERSQEMASIAETRGESGFRSVVGDIRNVRLAESFDAVISLFHVISYLTETADLQATFASAAKHLEIGGVFLFDVWHGPAVLVQGPSVRVRRMQDENLRVVRIAEPEVDYQRNRVTVNYTVFANRTGQPDWEQLQESHPMRYLFPAEIALLAEAAGFEVELCEAFETAELPSEQTWGVAYGLRKVR